MVKIKNLMYNNFLSVEVANEEGEEDEGGGDEASKSGIGHDEMSPEHSLGEVGNLVDDS